MLLLLLGLGIPLLGFVLWTTSEQASIESDHARDESRAMARVVAARLDDHIGEIDALIGTVAPALSLRAEDAERTNRAIIALRSNLPAAVVDVSVWDVSGKSLARTSDSGHGWHAGLVGRDFVRDAAHEHGLSVAGPLAADAGTERFMVWARPVVSAEGVPLAVVTVAERVERLEQMIEVGDALPPDSVVRLLDAHNQVLAMARDAGSLPLSGSSATASATQDLVADTSRVYGTKRLSAVPWSVSVSLSPDRVLGATRRHLYLTLAFGSCLLGVVLLLAAVAGRRMAVPIRQLASDARRFGSGELTHRSSVEGGSDVARLAQTMNQMAESLHNEKLELARSREWLKTITDQMPALIAYVDHRGRFAFANSHYFAVFGLQPSALIGRDAGEMLDPETREYVAPFARQVLSGMPTRFEFPVRVGGERREFEAIYLPDYGEAHSDSGAVEGYFVLARDVTNERRVARALEESERRVRTIADNMPLQIAYIDDKGVLTFTNRAFAQATGRAPDEVVGRHISEVLHGALYAASRPHFDLALKGETVHFERNRSVGTTTLTEEVNVAPDFDERGRVRGFYLLSYDISELKQTQQGLAMAERQLRSLTDNIPALIAHVDRDLRYRFANAHHARSIGQKAEDLIGRDVREVWGEEGYASFADDLQRALGGEHLRIEGESLVKGERRHHLTDFLPDVDAVGAVHGVYAMTFDITARKNAELHQAESEERLRTVTNNLPALICYIDRSRRYLFNNQTYETWFGKPIAQITGHLMTEVHPQEILDQLRPFIDSAFSGERSNFEVEVFRPEGGSRWVRGIYVPHRDEHGEVQGIYGLISDVTSVKAVEQQLVLMAQFDGLTGLPNRRQFDEKLSLAVIAARKAGSPLGLMFLDVDHFKSINDNLGHAAGDEVLREVAERLRVSVRTSDLVARLAGDEFVVLLETIHSPEEPQFVAKKILSAIHKPLSVEGRQINVTLSIGIAYTEGSELSGPGLLRMADRALYDAKNAGRDRFALAR